MARYPAHRHIALKEKAQFYDTGKPCRHGHTSPRYATGRACVECTRAYHQSSRGRTTSERWFKSLPYKEKLIIWARRRCKYRSTNFSIEASDLHWPERCPALGIALVYGTAARGTARWWSSATLDRLDNSKGYERGNVFVISRRANTVKAHHTLQELSGVVSYMTSAAKLEGDF